MNLFSCFTGGATIYVGQEVIKRFAPINQNAKLFAPVFGGALVSYLVTRRKTKICQQMWLALEERHSSLTPMEGQSMEGRSLSLSDVTKVTRSKCITRALSFL